jgi:CO dehydrogenase nickel-insertion accessory protein CooC1
VLEEARALTSLEYSRSWPAWDVGSSQQWDLLNSWVLLQHAELALLRVGKPAAAGEGCIQAVLPPGDWPELPNLSV